MITPIPSRNRPLGRLACRDIDLGLELHRLHHLADQTIDDNHHYHAVLLGKLKRIYEQVHPFLNR